MGAEPQQSSKVCRHCMVGKEARDDLLEPLPLFGDRPVHTPSQFPFDLLEFRCHAIAPGLPMDQERSSTCRAADQSKAQEVEGLRFAKPALLSLGRRMATKLNQSGFVRMQRQRELLQPLTHCVPEAAGVTLMPKAYDQGVGISHYDQVAGGLARSPALGPKIESVV